MNKKYIAIVAATITVTILASLIGLQFGKTDEFPPRLGDLTLSHVEGGEKAMKSTEQLARVRSMRCRTRPRLIRIGYRE